MEFQAPLSVRIKKSNGETLEFTDVITHYDESIIYRTGISFCSTAAPTTDPTKSPSSEPTNEPTTEPTYEPTAHICNTQLNVTLRVSISAENTSTEDMNRIITNVTYLFIESMAVDAACVANQSMSNVDVDTYASEGLNSTTSVSISMCMACDNGSFETKSVEDLTREYITFVGNESAVLLITLAHDSVPDELADGTVSSTSSKSEAETSRANEMEDTDIAWVWVVLSGSALLCLLFLFACRNKIRYHAKRQVKTASDTCTSSKASLTSTGVAMATALSLSGEPEHDADDDSIVIGDEDGALTVGGAPDSIEMKMAVDDAGDMVVTGDDDGERMDTAGADEDILQGVNTMRDSHDEYDDEEVHTDGINM